MKEARDTDNKIIAFAVFCGTLTGMLAAIAAPFFPLIYNTTAEARKIATGIILIDALFTPMFAFLHTTYFTLRSGGKTIITFIFDSVFMWVITVPVAYYLSRYTLVSAFWIIIIVHMVDWIKCIIGFVLVKKGAWMNNIVSDSQ